MRGLRLEQEDEQEHKTIGKKLKQKGAGLIRDRRLAMVLVDRLGLDQSLHAVGAQPFGHCAAIFHHVDLLDVDIPATAGRLARPWPVIAKLGALAAPLTLRHDCFPPDS